MAEEYKNLLIKKLHPSLKKVLETVAMQQPDDPIEFLACHMKHTSVNDDGQLVVANCEICNGKKGRSAKATLLSTKDSAEQLIQEALQKDTRLQVDNWRKAKVADAWTDLRRKYAALKWWDMAKTVRNKSKPNIAPVVNRKAWKTIRVFVSSTFKDMFCERDWLVKHVFPDLRNWCAERKLYLVECDLRWGVPKDSNSREILAACLNEIDRCREENTMPYFVGLLGHRYGWVPKEEDFPEDMKKQYGWIPGMSVTTLEVCTGSVWDNNPHSIFMLRDDKIFSGVQQLAVEHGVDADRILSGYRETDKEAVASLEMLKKLVRENQTSEQVASYSCELNGLTPDGAGGHRLNITGLREFGDKVLKFLKSRIAQQFVSLSNEMQSSMELQHGEHELFMEQRGAVLFGRSLEVSDIMKYIEDGVFVDGVAQALIVSGSAGTGKSSLIAHVAAKCMKEPSQKTVVHFVGATAGSTALSRVISRMWYECLDLAESEIPTDYDELKRSLEVVFRRASDKLAQNNQSRLVIFLDAVNQMDDEGDTLSLLWLPKQLPHNVRLVISTLEGRTLDVLREAKLSEVNVEPLTHESRMQIVSDFFNTYNKRLSEGDTQQLLQHADAGRPLWLSLACEELRVFGTFELLSQKIASLAGDLLGLERQIISRVISESAIGGDLMQAAFSLIRASRFGLVESELLQLLAIEPTLPEGSQLQCVTSLHEALAPEADKLPMQTWAVLYLDLRQFLRPVGSSGDGRLDFYHRSISKVVASMMYSDEKIKASWHRRLAEFFDKKVSKYSRKAEELPHHLLQLKDFEALEKVLVDYQMFEQLYKEDTKVQLLQYWRELGGYTKAADVYIEAFKAWAYKWFPNELPAEVYDPEQTIEQWVQQVLGYSSQYGSNRYSAACIVGAPQMFPKYGDSPLVWAPENSGQREFVELKFKKAVFVSAVAIYETYNAGGVSQVSLRDPSGNWVPVYKAEKIEKIQTSRKFTPPIERTQFKTDTIRIDIDGTECNDWVEIDAVKLDGHEVYLEQLPSTQKTDTNTQTSMSKQWISKVTKYSSQYGDSSYSANCIVGPPTAYPKYGDSATTWAPEQMGTSDEFIELEYDTEVYIAALCVYETYHAGGISKISVLDENGAWAPIYKADEIQSIEKSRKFFPPIDRPNFKTKNIRIDIDQSTSNNWCEYDAVALYGYDTFVQETEAPKDVVKRELGLEEVEEAHSTVNGVSEPEVSTGPFEKALAALPVGKFLVWLTAGVKLGWLFIDMGQFEVGEKHLAYVRDVSQIHHGEGDESQPEATKARQKLCEVFYALVVLYRSWFTKFSYATNEESQRAHRKGVETAKICYTLHEQFFSKEDLYFGEVAAACSYFQNQYCDEVIALFESKNYHSGLVELYSLKGTTAQYEAMEVTRGYHDKALKLAYSEFGKYHIKTARVHQLYGQMLWNRWAQNMPGEKTMERMNELFQHYWTEYEIFENLFGPDHTLTIRSREDNIIILGELGRNDDAAELQKKQPKGIDVRGQ